MRHPPRALVLAALLLAPPSTLGAQSLWPDSLRGTVEFGGEWIRPTLAAYDDAYPKSRGIWTLSLRARLRDDLQLVLAMPNFVGAGDGYGTGGGSGNPYIGVLMLDDQRRPRLAFGYRPALASRDAYYSPSIAAVADYDRFEAAEPDAATFNLILFHEAYRSDDGTSIRLRVGGTSQAAFIPGYGAGANFYFDYGLRVGRDTPALRAGLSVTGRWWIDSEGRSFGEASTNQAAVEFSFLPGGIRPYLGARLPLDRPLSQSLDYALILGLTATVH